MTSSSDKVRCIVRDGAVRMIVDNVSVHIPAQLLNKSQLLIDALSAVDDSFVNKEFTFSAPKGRLQAWMSRYGSKRKRRRCVDIEDLVNCLLVRICCSAPSPVVMRIA
jgi:hypothetical protein